MRRMRSQKLWLALVLVAVVALLELPTSCHGFSFDDLNMSKGFSKLKDKTNDWVNDASTWVLNEVAGLRSFRTQGGLDTAKFQKFYSFVKYSLREPFTNPHPWVKCVRIGWSECTKRNGGVSPISIMWCPVVVYYECERACGLPLPLELMSHPPIRRGV